MIAYLSECLSVVKETKETKQKMSNNAYFLQPDHASSSLIWFLSEDSILLTDEYITDFPTIHFFEDTAKRLADLYLTSLNKEEQDDYNECTICMEKKCEVKTSCNHIFCVICINKWYEDHDTCPICRTNLSKSSSTHSDSNPFPSNPEEQSTFTDSVQS